MLLNCVICEFALTISGSPIGAHGNSGERLDGDRRDWRLVRRGRFDRPQQGFVPRAGCAGSLLVRDRNARLQRTAAKADTMPSLRGPLLAPFSSSYMSGLFT